MNRRVFALGTFLSFVLAIGITAGVNYIAIKRPLVKNISQDKRFTLSERTKNVLKSLDTDINVYSLFSPDSFVGEWVDALITEYSKETKHIKYEKVDPYRDIIALKELAARFSVQQYDMLIIAIGQKYKAITEKDLVELDYSPTMQGLPPQPKAFKGETSITQAIMELTQKGVHRVYFTRGHGEKAIDDIAPGEGLSDFAKAIEGQGLAIESASIAAEGFVPEEENDIIVIAGPRSQFLKEELDWLNGWFAKKGRALVFLDPLSNTGIEGLLAQYGFAVGDDIVVDPKQNIVSPINVLVTRLSKNHPAVSRLAGKIGLLLPIARSVSIDAKNKETGILAVTSEYSWAERDKEKRPYKYDNGIDKKGPVPVAAAFVGDEGGPRIVVVGDSDFIANAAIDNLGNRDFVISLVDFLLGREAITGIMPKEIKTIKLSLTPSQVNLLSIIATVVFPMLAGGLGALVLFARRRF